MAFQTTATQPVTNPPVTLTFSGLMVLKPGANNTCDVGVHRFSREHLFQVILITKKQDLPPTLTTLFTGPLTSPFSVRLNPDPNPNGGDFVAFAPTQGQFDRGSEANDEKDFRWAVNFRDHHPNAEINGGAEPGISLTTGVLYTPNLSNPQLDPHLTKDGNRVFSLHQIAEDLAVSIVPPDGVLEVVLQWEDLGVEKRLELPVDDPNTTFTLAFTNNPPGLAVEAHDELTLYYRILKEGGTAILPDKRFGLGFAQGARSDEIPCMPTTRNP